ncbi:hypothetical protein QYM36_013411 [Artemia franciscana]|uniref:Uncharacterized protein n=1 Tax=Artemia franciscana TaxID=6661 RepID=A0AA88L6F8_ARTSF|nr:hypothetical protein QYM36_013411 [Artemia franciscana]
MVTDAMGNQRQRNSHEMSWNGVGTKQNLCYGVPGRRQVKATSNLDEKWRIITIETSMKMMKRTLEITTWNERSLKFDMTQAFTAKKLHQYNLDIPWLTKTRLNGNGKRTIGDPETADVSHFYDSGSGDSSGNYGAEFVLSDKIKSSMLTWDPVAQIVRILLHGHPFNVSVIAARAQTRDSPNHPKQPFL